VISTAVHPDTGEYIPWLFRFSSFLPTNMPIAFGMIFTAPTPFNTIFWQWFNQTYNAALNYQNRNASSQYTAQDIMMSYGMATGSSIAVALALRKLFAKKTAGLKGGPMYIMNALCSFFAVSAGGFLNAFFMRRVEMEKGIDVIDKTTGEVYGKSKACAKMAVM
jgi:sideroflexin-5